MSQFPKNSKLLKRPRFDLQREHFRLLPLRVPALDHPLHLFAAGIFTIFFELLLKLPLLV